MAHTPRSAAELAAAAICSASSTVFASGFSQSTCLPACRAAIAISAWLSPGVQMSMRSMSSRSTRRRQSISVEAKPSRSAAALTACRVAAGDRGQLGGERQVEETMGIAPRLGVGGAHEGVPHHADPHNVTHLSSPFSSPAGTARLALPITSCTDGQDASAAASSGRCSAASAWR